MTDVRARATAVLRVTRWVAAAVIGAIGMLLWDGDLVVGSFTAFVIGAAIGELLPIRQPRGTALPMSYAVLGAYALIGNPPHVVASIAALGWVLHALLRATQGSFPSIRELPERLATGWTLAGIATMANAVQLPSAFTLMPSSLQGELDAGGLHLFGAAVITLALVFGGPFVESIGSTVRQNVPLWRRFRDSLRSTWMATIAISATAALGALVHPALGMWTIPLMLLPLLAARIGLGRHTVIQTAYDQTIRAMSRLPEQLGAVTAGHGVRVGRLAVDVAHELGMDDAQVASVERAAYLHQLGRIPAESDNPTPREIAIAGARIIREAGDLEEVALIIDATADVPSISKRRDDVARAARIVWACAELDRYAPSYKDRDQIDEVMLRLVRSVGDIEVVAAVSRVVERLIPTPA